MPSPTPTTFLTLLGALTLLFLLYRIYTFLLPFLLPSKLSQYHYPSSASSGPPKPPWALVTGASDGIGKHLTRELALAGFNVVLHGRNPTKLANVLGQLQREFSLGGPERKGAREFRVLVADAGCIPCNNCSNNSKHNKKNKKNDENAGGGGGGGEGGEDETKMVNFDAIAAELADLHLTILINNAGGNPFRPVYQFIHEKPLAHILATTNLNAIFPMVLIHKLLPQLLRAGGPTLILNIGSLSDIGSPGLSAYSPCKAMMNSLTMGVSRELQMMPMLAPSPTTALPSSSSSSSSSPPLSQAATTTAAAAARNVHLQMIRVGEVCGTVYDKGPPSLFHPDASTMARACLARVGCGRRIVEGYLPHALQAWAVDLLPEWVADWAVLGQIGPRWKADAAMMKLD